MFGSNANSCSIYALAGIIAGLFMLAPASVRADVLLLQQNNSVQGAVWATAPMTGYADSATQAVSGYRRAYQSGNGVGVASSLAGTFTAQAHAEAFGQDNSGTYYHASASGHASFIFAVNDPSLTMHFTGRYGDSFQVFSQAGFTLSDLTTSSTVESWTSGTPPPGTGFSGAGFFDFTQTWAVDPTHQYQLALDASVGVWDQMTTSNITVSTPIPLPPALWMGMPVLIALPLGRVGRRILHTLSVPH